MPLGVDVLPLMEEFFSRMTTSWVKTGLQVVSAVLNQAVSGAQARDARAYDDDSFHAQLPQAYSLPPVYLAYHPCRRLHQFFVGVH